MSNTANRVDRYGDYLPYPANYVWYGTVDLLDFFGYFTDPTEKTAKAVDVLGQRLAAMELMIGRIRDWVADLDQRIGMAENLIRINFIASMRMMLESARHALSLGPSSANER